VTESTYSTVRRLSNNSTRGIICAAPDAITIHFASNIDCLLRSVQNPGVPDAESPYVLGCYLELPIHCSEISCSWLASSVRFTGRLRSYSYWPPVPGSRSHCFYRSNLTPRIQSLRDGLLEPPQTLSINFEVQHARSSKSALQVTSHLTRHCS
jgi:hypothetical protein